MFSSKDSVPNGLRSRVVYKFACAGCNACNVGETAPHFSTRAREHLASDRASHIFNINIGVTRRNLMLNTIRAERV